MQSNSLIQPNILMEEEMNTTELKIRHVLADGRVVDSIEGIVVPNTGATAAAYRILAEFAKNRPENIYQGRERKVCVTN